MTNSLAPTGSRPHPPRGGHVIAALALVVPIAAAFIAITPAAAAQFVESGSTSDTRELDANAGPASQWLWPVPAPIRVLDPFRAPPTPYAAGHRGIDLDTEPGASVVAPAGGVVSFAGQVAGRPVIAIDHGGGVVSAMEPVEASVGRGDPIGAGAVIGVVASGGHCADRCVHLGVRIDGEYVSPFLFLGGLPRAVLQPTR